jgi:hypothetical protein
MHYAKKAITSGLSFLTPDDEFCVAGFDHESIWWGGALAKATPAAVADCTNWINNTITAR